jgi:hypothetical protein
MPGLAGFGVQTPAGRRGAVIRVTNLNDAGAGSLRAALAARGARTILFEAGGTIALASTLRIDHPYVTIAGQTAPAPGVTLRGATLSIRAHDVLLQHVRVRPGDGTPRTDAIQILGPNGYNVVLDHVSASWGTDENIGTSGSGAHDITIANSISSEGLAAYQSAGLLVFDGSKNVTIVGSLFAHNSDRNPYFKGNTSGVFANNVVYNWDVEGAYHADPDGSGPSLISIVGNVFITGPNTAGPSMRIFATAKPGTRVYVGDNSRNDAPPPENAWSLVADDAGDRVIAAEAPVWPAGLVALPNGLVRSMVLAAAGAWPASRDEVDARVVEDVRTRAGGIIRTQAEVGGWPDLGAPQHYLTLPVNPNGDDDRDGYTNLEEWLHLLAARAEGR